MEQTTKPLWKLLNEQRTQGNLEVDIIEKEGEIHLLPNNKPEVFCSFYCLPFDEKIKPNAQYTALSVNNLHHLAEALEGIAKMNNKDFANSFHSKEETAKQIMFMGQLAKEALNRIS